MGLGILLASKKTGRFEAPAQLGRITSYLKILRALVLASCATLVAFAGACGTTAFVGGQDPSDAGNGADTSSGTDGSSSDAPFEEGGADSGTPPGTLTIASGQDNPHELVVKNGRIYWTNYSETNGTGSLWAADIDGANAIKLSPAHHANRLAVDQDLVYWSDYGTDTFSDSFVNASPFDAGAFAFHLGSVDPMGVAFNDESVYSVGFYLIGGGGSITRWKKDGNFDGKLVDFLDNPVSIAVDESGVVWTQAGAAPSSGQVIATDLDASVVGQGSSLPRIWGIAMSGNQAYYAERGAADGSGGGGIGVIDRTTGSASEVIMSGNHPYFITVDATNIYWTEEGTAASNGAVRYAKRNDLSTPHTFASGQARPRGIAIDANYIYWASYTGGEIFRSPLP